MDDATESSYWCYMCSRSVNPEIEGEIIKCNFCEGGFVVEMDHTNNDNAHDPLNNNNNGHPHAADSLWAPILIGMMNNLRDSDSNVQHEENEDNDDDDDDEEEEDNDGEIDLDRQFEAIISRRRSHSAAILDLLQGIRAGLSVESETNEDNPDTSELVVLINSFNQRLRIQESDDANSLPSGSVGDYFIGPGFEMLLQRLAENDPNNRFGTPPATKEAVEALAVVKIEEGLLQCTVCLDDFEIGIDVKEMPCKHKFHSDCLLPWLELHSSCPVCRYLLPTADDDEAKTDTETSRNDDSNDDISNASMENNGSSVDSSSINSSAN